MSLVGAGFDTRADSALIERAMRFDLVSTLNTFSLTIWPALTAGCRDWK